MSVKFLLGYLSLIFSVLGMQSLFAAQEGGFSGSISFTPAEVAQHLKSSNTVESVAGACLRESQNYFNGFYLKYKISPFYGENSKFAKLSYREQVAELTRRGLNASLLSEMKPMSCVGLVLKCLGAGFEQAGQKDIWTKIRAFMKDNGQDGLALQFALQKLDWKILYWNPKTSRNAEWDRNEQKIDPSNKNKFWGYHEDNWKAVSTRRKYLYNPVDDIDMMVNFETTPPASFQRIDFFVGTAHGGFHVFPGTFGRVVEAHSMREIDDPNTVETSPFNPMKEGGAPQGMYFSGLFAVPPGSTEW